MPKVSKPFAGRMRRRPERPLVVLTGLDDESLAARALQEGAQDYLVKGQMETREPRAVAALSPSNARPWRRRSSLRKNAPRSRSNSIADAVVCTDISGNISFLNLVAETMTGWSAREATRKAYHRGSQNSRCRKPRACPGSDGEGGSERSSPRALPSNSILVRRDGSEVPIENSVAPIHDSYGKSTGAVIVFHDVSAARAMAAEAAHLAAARFSDRAAQSHAPQRSHRPGDRGGTA